ncbi:DUF2244 domain-containing protein [Pseudoroseicyclus tamaricis]|uniref:DUF2244 domain-containing protein n=1 Tax=Pseudoroseicyclus tamaricis TaxID=2705421 RepID=A0A6B2JKJ9_9RHOB|nr:DUF2244 domain-containing protein [Pseudoroseicyclus tamaricis]NDV02021.1 DUF2244 domain-containing protein [Pseudoroseicyclus tamaricis]
MPYEWVRDFDTAPDIASGAVSHRRQGNGDPPHCALRVWPNNSLEPSGFATFIAATATLMALPLVAVLGSPVLWVVLLFLLPALAAIWWALRHNQSSRQRLVEELTLWEDRLEIARREAGKADLQFAANPYWVEVTLHKEGGPVEDYLTLRGGARTVELGAFLAPEERRMLAGDLDLRLARIRHVGASPRPAPGEG